MADDIRLELQSLARQLNLCDGSEQNARVREWMGRVETRFGSEDIAWAFDVLTIYRARGIVIGNLHMEDNSVKVGGDNYGNVAGGQAIQLVRDSSVYVNRVDNSTNISNPELKQALKQARSELDALDLSEAVKTTVLQNFGNLTIELDKPKPDKTALEIFWGGLKAVASKASSLLKVGALLKTLYGVAAAWR